MKRIILVFLFILSSCLDRQQPTMSFAEFDLKLTEEWIYTTSLTGLRTNGEIITRPPGVEQLIMTLRLPALGGLHYKKHCVYYTVPYKEKAGKLLVEETKDLDSCPEYSTGKSPFLSLEDMSDLKISLEKFKLSLVFNQQKEKRTIDIPMPNIEAGLIHEKYRAIQEKQLMSGLKFMRITDESMDFSLNRYLGKLSDRFSTGTAIRCHQVDKDCNTIGENRCEECRYGWYEVVDFQCPGGGSKFCGQNRCGEKNEPACPRGVKVVGDDEAGICQSDLEPRLNSDKILICL